MEVFFIIIGLIFLGAIAQTFKKKPICHICNAEISPNARKEYKWLINGKKKRVCTKCNRKLGNQLHKKNFDAFFAEEEEEEDYYYAFSKSKNNKNSRYITPKTKQEVWQRDRGRCVECDSKENLEYDHIIPHSKGGSNNARNIQLLCETCNRQKRNKIL